MKRFGKQTGKFSFPMEGYTLALDFPVNEKTFELLEKLDEITLKYGGRFYLAKDARMKKEVFKNLTKGLENISALETKMIVKKILFQHNHLV